MTSAFASACLAGLAAATLASCIAKPVPEAQPPAQRERLAYLRKTQAEPITCTLGADCAQKWERARAWVTQHTTYSIKTSTNDEIATAGPIEPTTDAAYRVTRSQLDANTGSITFSSTCGEGALCSPTSLEQAASFHNFVLGGR